MALSSGTFSSPNPAWAAAKPVVNDITLLNPIFVDQVVMPRSTEDIRGRIKDWLGPISIGGARYSMGGQIAAEDSLHFDMRTFNKLVRLDTNLGIVRVQAGMRWRDLQTIIDPHDLSVKIMQSYSNFTIGGALSVNAHGRYVGLGPLVNSVRSIQLLMPGGVIAEVSSTQNSDLFYAAIGGYGGLGVVTEVELDLVPNIRMERQVSRVLTEQYPAFFSANVRGRPGAVLHNADVDPFFPDRAVATTWFETEKPVTVSERLYPAGALYPSDAFEIRALADLPGSHFLRRNVIDPIPAGPQIVWRNHEASLDVATLGRIATSGSTFALQEYFLPVAQFASFMRQMSRILTDYGVDALNVSIRHSPPDGKSVLAWARDEVFSFVLYYRQGATEEDKRQVEKWTQQLIDAALLLGGTYYLPYQLNATQAQFNRAYPDSAKYFAIKARVDPQNQFRNKLLEKYHRL